MRIDDAFTIASPAARVWATSLDVETIAPCVPGATLLEVVDDHTWRGKVDVRLGPVVLAFEGEVTVLERDDIARRMVLRARGSEHRGRGAASADVTTWVEEVPGGGTAVRISTDLTLSGAVAQMSRGLLPEVSKRLTKDFADRLQMTLTEREAAIGATGGAPSVGVQEAGTPKALGGLRLGFFAAWSAVKTAMMRLIRREPPRT